MYVISDFDRHTCQDSSQGKSFKKLYWAIIEEYTSRTDDDDDNANIISHISINYIKKSV